MSAGRRALERFTAGGARFLGVERAILCGAMTWVSERSLVAAIARAGGFGVLACGGMDPDALSEEIAGAKALTDRPFGVNLVVLHPELDRLIEVCLDHAVSHVVLAGGVPSKAQIDKARSGGGRVIGFAPSLAIARRLLRNGAGGLVIEGSEAGGHVGPVSTSVLAQEILPHVGDAPVFVAGGVGCGEAVAAFVRMGAAGAQIGTMFAVAEESVAHPAFKQAFVRAASRDAVLSTQIDPDFKVIPVRALANAATRQFAETQVEVIAKVRAGAMDAEEAQLAIERFWVGALRRGVREGDVESGSLMAGQSVGMIKSVRPTAEIMDELIDQAAAAMARDAPSARGAG